ncbi:YeiH family protein [Amaricoccus macauensis]|uniref:YeiH family protein n=1 Tax=Amaricoccus macauensis TaxID=57001 RepID=UPI003C7D2EEF
MKTLPIERSAIMQTGRELAPGVFLALTIAAAATFLSEHYGAPTMLFALLIGMAFQFMSVEGPCVQGIAFSSRTMLRIGVALLGVRVTFTDITALGLGTVLIVISLIALTIGTGFLAARLFGRGWRFALLTGGSVAICGASAALALAAVIPTNDKLERNTLFTVVGVTTLSTIAMISYPILFLGLGLNDFQSGFLIGATIHDVAQVVGAGYSISDEAGEVATIVKLLRVSLLPVVLLIAILCLRSTPGTGARPTIPAFVVAFAILVVINSLGLIPDTVESAITDLSRWILVTAIAALGMKTTLKAMAEVGGGHVGIIVIETLVLLFAATAIVIWGGWVGGS